MSANQTPYQVVALTGASRGIGRALALKYAQQGSRLILLARNRDLLKTLSDEVALLTPHVFAYPCDVGNREEVLAGIRSGEEKLGPVDLLIANAGVSYPCPIAKFDGVKVEEIYRTNLLGSIFAIEAVLPSMLKRSKGHIVAISSVASFVSLPQHSAYCGSKAALNAQIDGMRPELQAKGISVTTICPGFIRTDMTAKNRFSMPFILDLEPAAEKIFRAIEKRRTIYAFPWQIAFITRFLGLLPRVIRDRLLKIPGFI